MANQDWKSVFDELGLEAPSETEAPGGEIGSWLDATTRFARRGFIRVLVQDLDPLHWYVEAAHPDIGPRLIETARLTMERAAGSAWSAEKPESGHVVLRGSAPPNRARAVLIPALLIADAVTADRDDLGDLEERLEKMEAPEAEDETPGEADAKADESEPDADQARSAAEPVEATEEGTDAEEGSPLPFESIGDDEIEADDRAEEEDERGEEAPTATSPRFAFDVTDDYVAIGIGLPERLDLEDYEAALEAWSGSLRGRYDVRTEAPAPEASRELELPGATTRLVLHVFPDALEGNLTVADVAADIEEHIDTLRKVAEGGIDPLVFLGVRGRTPRSRAETGPRSAGPFETIGEEELDHPEPESDEGTTVFYVAEETEETEETEAEEEPGGVVLDLSTPPADGDALEPGRFDDPRLDRPDATTRLVDVVLRHPGYSDRNIGQVLSILLSIDYSDALALADSAPRVIAWGVGGERARTMKTVIEGAGGKVKLVEPETFAPG